MEKEKIKDKNGITHNIINLAGQKFGRLTVLNYDHSYNGTSYYKCQCSCKNKTIKIISRKSLVSGGTLSCGCLSRERVKESNITHNMTNTRFYRIWHHIKQRCTNPNNEQYYNYGGRGIFICEAWKKFINFYEDMYFSYVEESNFYGEHNISIDRIDVNDGYYKENCRWTTMQIQTSNRRNNRRFLINGKEYILKDVVRDFAIEGLSYGTVRDRLDAGYNILYSLTTPKNEKCIHNINPNKKKLIRRPIYFDIDIKNYPDPREI